MRSCYIKDESVRVLRLLGRMNVGGPSIHVINLTQSMKPFGFQTRLASGEAPAIEGSMIPFAKEKGLDPQIVPHLTREIRPLWDAAALFAIMSEIRRFRPHIVETHTAKAGLLGRIAAMFCKVPITVHTFHGTVFNGYFTPAFTSCILAIERMLAKTSDLIVTLSNGQRREILNSLRPVDESKFKVVPLGLDLKPFLQLPRKPGIWRRSVDIPPEACLLGIVARLVPVKNHLAFLNSFAKVAAENSRLHLAIVGGGEQEPAIRKRINELGLSRKVTMTGIIQPIDQVYADLDLVVLPSRSEGTPLVLIEALASGCPVAATRVGGIPELLDGIDGSFLLSTDPEEMTIGLKQSLCKLKHLTQAAEANRFEMQRRFPIETLASSMASLYRSLLSRN